MSRPTIHPASAVPYNIRYAEKIGQYLGTPFPAGFHSSHPVQGRICAGLESVGLNLSAVPNLAARLEAVQERFLEGI